MASQNCSNCSAPLSFDAGEEVVDCTYCGATNRLRAPRRRAGATAAAAGTGAGCVAGALLAGVGLLVALFVLLSDRDEPPPAPTLPGVDLQSLPAARPDAGVAPADLGRSGHPGWIPVATEPAVGGYERFEPVANLPWALSVARQWQPDAELGSIYLDGARTEGVLDLRSNRDWDVDYRFYSPSLRARARQLAEVSEKSVRTEFRLKVSEGAIKALISERHGARDDALPGDPPRCGFGEVMARAVEGGLATRPTYRVVLLPVSGA